LGKYFSRFSYPGTQRLLQPWFTGNWILLELEAGPAIIRVLLILQACKIPELKSHGSFHTDFKGKLARPGNLEQNQSLQTPRRRYISLSFNEGT
jgi:hypothetical protein